MKIKRFLADDVRQAIQQVREQLGPDAVILSNLQINGGIEIVAAIDYDESLAGNFPSSMPDTTPASEESPVNAHQHNATSYIDMSDDDSGSDRQENASHINVYDDDILDDIDIRRAKPVTNAQSVWSQEPTLIEMRRELESIKGMVEHQLSGLAWGDLGRRHPQRMKLLKHLMTMGVGPVLCNEIADTLQESSDFNNLWRRAMGELSRRIPVSGDLILHEGGVVALVGPTGVGKTTTAAKLAARCVMRHGPKSVALVTMDNYRVAAHEQIRVYGRILGIPVRIASNQDELHDILKNLRSKRLVIIDTVGMSQRDARLNNQFSLLAREDYIKNYLVLSTSTQMQSIDESVRVFSSLNLDGCILTKLDESTSLGGALSVAIQKDMPIAYITDGQRVPEDIHPARKNNLVHSAVQIMKNSDHSMMDEWLALAFGDLAVNGNG